MNGSSALKLMPLCIRRAMMPRPAAKAMPKYEKGYLDHVAFSCDDLENFIIKLNNLGVAYTRRDFNLSGDVFTQLEVTDPVGNGVELNFSQ